MEQLITSDESIDYMTSLVGLSIFHLHVSSHYDKSKHQHNSSNFYCEIFLAVAKPVQSEPTGGRNKGI